MIRRVVTQSTKGLSTWTKRSYARTYVPGGEPERERDAQRRSLPRQPYGHVSQLRNQFISRLLIGGVILSFATYYSYQYYQDNVQKLNNKNSDGQQQEGTTRDWRNLSRSPKTRTLRSEAAVCRTRIYELEVVRGDITEETTDAIVNAANTRLQHGGGLAKAIVVKGGPQVQADSDKWIEEHGQLPVGGVAVTDAHGDLHCKKIIHVVGPVWTGGDNNEDQLLTNAIQAALETADRLGLQSISIPAVSSGIYKFPKERCAHIIYKGVFSYFNSRDLYVEQTRGKKISLNKVRLINIDEPTVDAFVQGWDNLKKQGKVM